MECNIFLFSPLFSSLLSFSLFSFLSFLAYNPTPHLHTGTAILVDRRSKHWAANMKMNGNIFVRYLLSAVCSLLPALYSLPLALCHHDRDNN
jgi:hypothetical protein